MAQPHTLLIVDDEPDVVQSLRDLLRRHFRVLGATHARDGLRLLRQEPVHLVLTDQRMPEVSGIEFLDRVRRERPEAVRLLCTGYADLKAVIDAINVGHVYRYVTKPWDPDELAGVLRQAAEQYDLLEERRRLLDELTQTNRDLERANAELREADALKEAFIRVASHELRTPLTILLALPEVALRAPGLGAREADWFRRIEEAGGRLHRLVEQLLEMLRAGRFDRPLERRPADVAALVRAAAEGVRPFVGLRRQNLTLDLADDLGRFDVEADKIRVCLDNLLINAIKFTPDGGAIEVRGRGDGEAVTLRVADTGVGIAAADLPRVFEAFFTERDVSRHASGQFEFGRRGLGLGLSLVRAFVRMHGGTVDVASTPGRGTTFTLALPRSPPPAPGGGGGAGET